MNNDKKAAETITRSFPSTFIIKGLAIFIAGSLLTALILHFATYAAPGASYGESFRILSILREEIIHKSFIVYFTTTIFVIAGVVVISLIYSHRVAGPLYKLGMVSQKIAAGDLTDKVILRRNDAVHTLAEDLNTVSRFYDTLFTRMQSAVDELSMLVDSLESSALAPGVRAVKIDEAVQKVEHLKNILNAVQK